MSHDRLRAIVEEHLDVVRTAADELLPAVDRLADLMIDSLERGGRVIVFGNGGSAADAQHLVAELVGRYRRERRPLPALALTTDPSVVTAIGNDYDFADLFARQVTAQATDRDLVIGISTSGGSRNVVRGLRAARERGARTAALTGAGGGEVAASADHVVAVPSAVTARIQEVHGLVVHMVCERIDDWALGEPAGGRGPAHREPAGGET